MDGLTGDEQLAEARDHLRGNSARPACVACLAGTQGASVDSVLGQIAKTLVGHPHAEVMLATIRQTLLQLSPPSLRSYALIFGHDVAVRAEERTQKKSRGRARTNVSVRPRSVAPHTYNGHGK